MSLQELQPVAEIESESCQRELCNMASKRQQITGLFGTKEECEVSITHRDEYSRTVHCKADVRSSRERRGELPLPTTYSVSDLYLGSWPVGVAAD